MAKIRGIKPEFWTDEDIVELSLPARLLFIGLWNLACDNGHVPDKPKQIKMRLLPADDVNVDKLLDELAESGRIERSAGTITIRKFAHHQRPHKRWWTTCDLPLCEVPEDAPEQGFNRGKGASKAPAQPLRNRGTTVGHGRTTADGDGDGDGDYLSVTEPPKQPARASGDAPDFDTWWDQYPRKVAKGQARKAYRTARKKASSSQLLEAVQRQRQMLTAKGPEFCPHASTWLNGERWNDEVPAAALAASNGVRYHPDGTVDESSLPPVEETWMRRRPT